MISSSDLCCVVNELNRDLFSSNFGVVPNPGFASVRLSSNAHILRSSIGNHADALTHNSTLWTNHFRGEIRGNRVIADLESYILLRSQGLTGKTAVGHVLDDSAKNARRLLPIVVVIGINYTQHSPPKYCYLNKDVPIWDATGMRDKIDGVFTYFRTRNPPLLTLPMEYHVVATNIFPWITTTNWGSLTCHEEMILMQMHGYSNPVAICDDLILNLHPHLEAIIFHGDNCVAQYGAQWINTRRRHSLYSRLPTSQITQSETDSILLCEVTEGSMRLGKRSK